MRVIRGGFGSRKPAFDRPRARCRRRRRPGLPGRRPVGPAARDRLGPARRRPSSSGPRPARSPGRRCGSGCPATDLAASLYGVPTSRRGGAILRRILPADAEPLPTPSVGSLFRPWNLPSPALIARVARRPLAFRPEVAAMTLLPRGRIDISERARGLDEHMGEPLARRPADLRRPPLGRRPRRLRPRPAPRRPAWPPPSWPRAPSPATSARSTSRAPSTSTAGVHSATNADVLRSEGLDVVVIVSSMSAAQGSANGADGWLRRTVHRRMEREIARLRGGRDRGDQPGARCRVAPGHGAAGHGRGPEPPGDRGRLRGDPAADPRHAPSSPRWASPLAAATAG